MLSPDEQQIAICLLKTNLDEVKNEIVSQAGIISSVNKENKRLNSETANALHKSSSLNEELERLKLENVRLSAKRVQLVRQCEKVQSRLARIEEQQTELVQFTKEEELAIESEVRKYETTLRAIADKFRNTTTFNSREAILFEMGNMEKALSELDAETEKRQNELLEMNDQLQNLAATVPEDILNIVGKRELEEKLELSSADVSSLTSQREILRRNLNVLT